MSFLASIFLWALPLAGIPVILHLLSRRRRRVIHWGATRFLREAMPRRRRLWSLEDWLLMLLRAAAVAAVVTALAMPLLRGDWIGTSSKRDVILILDTTLSTSRTSGHETRFDRMIRTADELVASLREGDTLRVLLASTLPEWIASEPIEINAASRLALRGELGTLKSTTAGTDLLRCLHEALDAPPASEDAARIVAVLTDAQRGNWHLDAQGAWSSLRDKLARSANAPTVNVVLCGGEGAGGNLSLESLDSTREVVPPAAAVRLTARVKNTALVPSPGAPLHWFIAGQPVGSTEVDKLDPNQTAASHIEYAFDAPGVYEVTCRIGRDDALPGDNVAHRTVEVAESLDVLIVCDSDDPDPGRTDTEYLLTVLGYGSGDEDAAAERARWRSVFVPRVVRADALEREPLDAVHCIVLANTSPLSDEAVGRIEQYVAGGGGLWIAFGDRTDERWVNRALYAKGKGLLPLPLADPVGDERDRERAFPVLPPAEAHPAMAVLSDTKRVDLNRIRVYRRHRFETALTGSDSVPVLLRTTDGEPFALEAAFGDGRVIAQAVGLDVRWSNLPACEAFVVGALEWLWHLSSPSMTRWNLDPGQPIRLALPAANAARSVRVRTPLESEVDLVVLDRGGRSVYSLPAAGCPGAYLATIRTTGEPDRTVTFHVRRDTGESVLTDLADEDLPCLAKAGLSVGADPLALRATGVAVARLEPAWGVLLAAVLGMMAIESLLAARLTRRRFDQPAGLTLGDEVPLGGMGKELA